MADPNPFKDKVILVTGAAQGFGEAIAEYVAARGASLSLVDLQGDKLAATALRISKAHPDIKVLTAALDITDEKAVEEWVMASKEKLGKISGCVNNAGTCFSLFLSLCPYVPMLLSRFYKNNPYPPHHP